MASAPDSDQPTTEIWIQTLLNSEGVWPRGKPSTNWTKISFLLSSPQFKMNIESVKIQTSLDLKAGIRTSINLCWSCSRTAKMSSVENRINHMIMPNHVADNPTVLLWQKYSYFFLLFAALLLSNIVYSNTHNCRNPQKEALANSFRTRTSEKWTVDSLQCLHVSSNKRQHFPAKYGQLNG